MALETNVVQKYVHCVEMYIYYTHSTHILYRSVYTLVVGL